MKISKYEIGKQYISKSGYVFKATQRLDFYGKPIPGMIDLINVDLVTISNKKEDFYPLQPLIVYSEVIKNTNYASSILPIYEFTNKNRVKLNVNRKLASIFTKYSKNFEPFDEWSLEPLRQNTIKSYIK